MATYFVSEERNSNGNPVEGTFWRRYQNYGTIDVHINLHLLAYSVGDELPPLVADEEYVSPQNYCLLFNGQNECVNEVNIQPWAKKRIGNNEIIPLAIGPRLLEFLDDPLGTGERMNLLLPFTDANVELTGGWVRSVAEGSDQDAAFHGGFDFRNDTTNPRTLFSIAAAADGRVMRASNKSICLHHASARGAEFYTIYRHLDNDHFQVQRNDTVRAGQVMGKIIRWNESDGDDISHLHFVVAVWRPGFSLGDQNIPGLWYAIDPFGVYDYLHPSTYVEVRPGGFERPLSGNLHTLQFRTDPLIRSFPGVLKTVYRSIEEIKKPGTEVERLPTPWPTACVRIKLNRLAGYFWLPLSRFRNPKFGRRLLNAHLNRSQVSLGYRWSNGFRMVTLIEVQP